MCHLFDTCYAQDDYIRPPWLTTIRAFRISYSFFWSIHFRGQFMPIEERAQAIQSRHKWAENLSAELKQTIKNKSARDHLLVPALNSLHDVERVLLPQALKASPAYASMWF